MPRSKLAGFSLAQLKAEVRRRIREIGRLVRQRNELERLLHEIGKLAGRPGRKGGKKAHRTAKKRGKAAKKAGRKKRGASLADALAKVLADKGGVKVAEATKLVRAAGYQTKAKNFPGIVSQTLRSDARFRKVRRGVFALKR